MKSRAKSSSKASSTPSPTGFQEGAYRHVKARILNMTYRAGDAISDTAIAKEMGVSRTPVREALILLENEGFIVSKPRRGWTVRSLTIEDINEIFDVKSALEPMISRKAAVSDNPSARRHLKERLEEMKQAAAAKDLEAWRHADMQLHQALFVLCGNKRAARIITQLNEQWYRVLGGNGCGRRTRGAIYRRTPGRSRRSLGR